MAKKSVSLKKKATSKKGPITKRTLSSKSTIAARSKPGKSISKSIRKPNLFSVMKCAICGKIIPAGSLCCNKKS